MDGTKLRMFGNAVFVPAEVTSATRQDLPESREEAGSRRFPIVRITMRSGRWLILEGEDAADAWDLLRVYAGSKPAPPVRRSIPEPAVRLPIPE